MSFNYSTKTLDLNSPKASAILALTLGKTFGEYSSQIDLLSNGYFSQLRKDKALKTGRLNTLMLSNNGITHCLSVAPLHLNENTAPIELKQTLARICHAASALNEKELYIAADQAVIDALGGYEAYAALICKSFEYHAYQYDFTLSKKKTTPKLTRITLINSGTKQAKQQRDGFKLGQAQAAGLNYARELGNLPGNYCTPAILGEKAKELATTNSKLSVKVLGLKAIERLKMGAFLSVAKGSSEEPRFIIFEYKGKNTGKPTVLVGKGITFDTGGISIKPGPSMDEMKYDMCGAASVFGCIKALCDMNANVNVVGIIAAAENMPAGNASKPGDVVTSMSGQTIEILNTDAEGRLVLCDALTYAERFKPKAVIDIATLTGACVIALGTHASGLYANDQNLAEQLLSAGQETGDRAWQMPLWSDYEKQLKSNFADMANIGGREGGSITAACFLAKYTKAYSWAHLDIAGSA